MSSYAIENKVNKSCLGMAIASGAAPLTGGRPSPATGIELHGERSAGAGGVIRESFHEPADTQSECVTTEGAACRGRDGIWKVGQI